MQLKRRQISGDGPGARGFPAAALLGIGAAAAVCGSKAGSERRMAPLLDPADLSTWTTWKFVGETRYALVEKDVRYVDAVALHDRYGQPWRTNCGVLRRHLLCRKVKDSPGDLAGAAVGFRFRFRLQLGANESAVGNMDKIRDAANEVHLILVGVTVGKGDLPQHLHHVLLLPVVKV